VTDHNPEVSSPAPQPTGQPAPGRTGDTRQQHPGEDPQRVAGLLAAAARGGPGGERAWREIIRLYGRRVYALAHSRLRRMELAEEVTQSVFATVAEKLAGRAHAGGVGTSGGYAEQGRFESWLFRIAMNRIRDEVRRRRRQAEPADPAIFRDVRAESPQERPDEADLRQLQTALSRLSEADREIIELRHHGQMSFREMADLLGEPLGTLLARHHRALKKLKQMLEPGPANLEQPETSDP
jgi:RNA polymerase sigma-70 factor, ECF subfamily